MDNARRFKTSECYQYTLDHPGARFVLSEDYEAVVGELADMTADYHRWHEAYMDLKYPGSAPETKAESDCSCEGIDSDTGLHTSTCVSPKTEPSNG